jgi:hypothetical protein
MATDLPSQEDHELRLFVALHDVRTDDAITLLEASRCLELCSEQHGTYLRAALAAEPSRIALQPPFNKTAVNATILGAAIRRDFKQVCLAYGLKFDDQRATFELAEAVTTFAALVEEFLDLFEQLIRKFADKDDFVGGHVARLAAAFPGTMEDASVDSEYGVDFWDLAWRTPRSEQELAELEDPPWEERGREFDEVSADFISAGRFVLGSIAAEFPRHPAADECLALYRNSGTPTRAAP